MSNKAKSVCLLLGFIALLAGGSYAYNTLSAFHIPDAVPVEPQPDAVDAAEADGAAEEQPTQEERVMAADFSVLNMDGDEVRLSDYFGKPVVINFWASWCPPCKSEMPEFEAVYQDMGEEVAFLMIDLVDGSRETVEKGKGYIDSQGFTFPVFFDVKQEAANLYGIYSIPTSLFLDSEGYIVTGAIGAINEEALRTGIRMAQEAGETGGPK